MKSEYLAAMKADCIPTGESGLWFVVKLDLPEDRLTNRFGKATVLPRGTYTYLRCLTDATIYDEQPGALVMEDTPFELQTHLGFVMRAYGRVLVTGLGLGCVVRGLLANPKVESVTCIENSTDVLKLVAPHMPAERLTIIEADALEWTAKNKENFDCAWHDLWVNPDQNAMHLDIWHTQMIFNCKKYINHQGAWSLRREMKRLLTKKDILWMG